MLNCLNNTQKGILLALTGFAAFVCSDSVSKYLAAHYSVLSVVAWIYAFALIICILFSPFIGGLKKTLQTKKLKLHFARGAANFGLAISVVYAFQNLPLTSVYPILFLSPFVMSTLAFFLYKEKVRPRDWLIMTIGFSGVLIAYRPGFEALDPWLLAPVATTIFAAVFGLIARALGQSETTLSLGFYPSLINVILLSPFMISTLPTAEHLLIFSFGGLMLSIGMICVASAYRIARFAVVSPVQYLQLVMAFAVGHFVFHETPSIWMIIGSLVIITSGVLMAVSHTRR